MKHDSFTQQKLEQKYDQRQKLHNGDKFSQSIPYVMDWKCKKLIWWVPIIIALIFITYGIIRQQLWQQQKYYCYKSPFKPNKQPPQTYAAQQQVLAKTRYNYQIYVDPQDKQVGMKILQNGTYQPDNINLIGHIVQMGDNVLVVGSHYGIEAVTIAKVIGSLGKLYLLEPRDYQYELIKKTIHRNQLDKITTLFKDGASNIKQQKKTEQIGSSEQSKLSSQKTLQYDKIDDILPRGLKLDFAYINSQQMTIKALLGMREVINRSTQLVLMIKWDYDDEQLVSQEQFNALIRDVLDKKGYKAYSYDTQNASFRQDCQLGELIYRENLQKLYNNRQELILLIPQNYSLPK